MIIYLYINIICLHMCACTNRKESVSIYAYNIK